MTVYWSGDYAFYIFQDLEGVGSIQELARTYSMISCLPPWPETLKRDLVLTSSLLLTLWP